MSGPIGRRAVAGGLAAGVLGTVAFAGRAEAKPKFTTVTQHVLHPGGQPDEKLIQAALDLVGKAGGGHVLVDAGTWQLRTAPLLIHANTRLTLTPGTILKRTGELSALLSNGPRDGSDTTTARYQGAGNIIVEGGIWDGNSTQIERSNWGLVFGHAANITVRDLEVRNTSNWHAIEYNAIDGGAIENCRLRGYRLGNEPPYYAEAISVDYAKAGLTPFGAGDDTQSRNIRIVGNFCEDYHVFIGCHNANVSGYFDQLVISGNTARNCDQWGIGLKNAARAIVTDNTLVGAGGGIWIHTNATYAGLTQPMYDIVVAGNVISDTLRNEGIRVEGYGDPQLDGKLYGIACTDNIIRRAHKAGIAGTWTVGMRVSGNLISEVAGPGVRMAKSTDPVIQGNQIDAPQFEGAAITLQGTTDAMVQGNRVRGKAAHGVADDAAASGTLCTGNDLRRGYRTAALSLVGPGHLEEPGNAV